MEHLYVIIDVRNDLGDGVTFVVAIYMLLNNLVIFPAIVDIVHQLYETAESLDLVLVRLGGLVEVAGVFVFGDGLHVFLHQIEGEPVALSLASPGAGRTSAHPDGAVLGVLQHVAEVVVGFEVGGILAQGRHGHEADGGQFGHLLDVYADGGEAVTLVEGLIDERADAGALPGGLVGVVLVEEAGEVAEVLAGLGLTGHGHGAHKGVGGVERLTHGGRHGASGPAGGEFLVLAQHTEQAAQFLRRGTLGVGEFGVGDGGGVVVVAARGERQAASQQQGAGQQADECLGLHDG